MLGHAFESLAGNNILLKIVATPSPFSFFFSSPYSQSLLVCLTPLPARGEAKGYPAVVAWLVERLLHYIKLN